MKLNLLLIPIVFLLAACTTLGDDLVPPQALDILAIAKNGNPEAQERIGEMFHYGYGVKKNFTIAARWYRLAANQNYASSQDYLGLLYAGGLGVEEDCAESEKWFDRAMKNGYPESKNNLAWMLATCKNPSYRDGKRAVKLALEVITETEASWSHLGTLAAAYAEIGDFEKAVEAQTNSLYEIELIGLEEEIANAKSLIELYRSGKPSRGASYESPNDYSLSEQ